MQIAGQECALKVNVPMRAAKRGLKLCDLLREKGSTYLEDEGEEGFEELQTLWAEFCAIAFDAPIPTGDVPEPKELAEACRGFMQARSRTSV